MGLRKNNSLRLGYIFLAILLIPLWLIVEYKLERYPRDLCLNYLGWVKRVDSEARQNPEKYAVCFESKSYRETMVFVEQYGKNPLGEIAHAFSIHSVSRKVFDINEQAFFPAPRRVKKSDWPFYHPYLDRVLTMRFLEEKKIWDGSFWSFRATANHAGREYEIRLLLEPTTGLPVSWEDREIVGDISKYLSHLPEVKEQNLILAKKATHKFILANFSGPVFVLVAALLVLSLAMSYPMNAIFTTAVGGGYSFMVLAGWFLQYPTWVKFHAQTGTIQFTTAWCFALLAIAQILCACEIRRGRAVLIGVVAVICIATIFEYGFPGVVNTSNFFVRDFVNAGIAHAGQMSPNSLIVISALGVAIAVGSTPRSRVGLVLFLLSHVVVLTMLAASFLGYVFDLKLGYKWIDSVQMSVQSTAIASFFYAGMLYLRMREFSASERVAFGVSQTLLLGAGLSIFYYLGNAFMTEEEVRFLNRHTATQIEKEFQREISKLLVYDKRELDGVSTSDPISEHPFLMRRIHLNENKVPEILASFRQSEARSSVNHVHEPSVYVLPNSMRLIIFQGQDDSRVMAYDMSDFVDFIRMKYSRGDRLINIHALPFQIAEMQRDIRRKGNAESVPISNIQNRVDIQVSQLGSQGGVPTTKFAFVAILIFMLFLFGAIGVWIFSKAIRLNDINSRLRRAKKAAAIRFDAVFNSAPAPLLVVNQIGRVRYANDALLKLLETPRVSIIGKNLADLLTSPIAKIIVPAIQHPEGAGFARDESVTTDVTLPSGEVIRGEIDFTVFRSLQDSGAILRVADLTAWESDKQLLRSNQLALANVIEDIRQKNTDLEVSQIMIGAQLTKLEFLNAELERFAAIASHDLKAPLRGVAQLAGMIVEDLKLGETDEIEENVALMTRRLRGMSTMIDDLLLYAKIGSEKESFQRVHLNELVEQVIDLQYIPQGFEIVIQGSVKPFLAPPAAIRRVIQNLISNAVKHYDKNDKGYVEVRLSENDSFVTFVVSDNGPGIPASAKNKIYELFATLQPRDKVEGSGLGLNIVKKTLETHGATIHMESVLGVGTIFSVDWPKQSDKDR